MLLAVLLCAGLLFAFVYGGSNLGYTGYPSFSSYYRTSYLSYNNSVSEREFNNYRNSVREYTESAQKYVENANNDIDRIHEAQQDAIRKANAAVDEFNSWASRVKVTSKY